MPFIANNLEEDEQQKQLNQGQNISGTSTQFNSSPPGAQQNKQQKSSGSFVNIQKYLDANKEQAADMSNTIVQDVESNAQKAQSDINTLASKKQTVQDVNPSSYLDNVTQLDDTKKQEYRDLRQTGGYKGPNDVTEIAEYQNAYGSANKAQSLVDATKSEEGRKTLLQETYKRPNYTSGMKSLDQALFQNDATSKQKFADINTNFSGINSFLQNTANDVGNSINDSKSKALNNKNSLLTAEQQAWNNLLNPIQQRASAANRDNPNLVSRIQDDVSDETLSEETLNLLGLSEGKQIYDLNLGNYLNTDLSQVGLNEAANDDERAKYLALQNLIQDQSRNEITADGRKVSPVGFDMAKFEGDRTAKETEYNTQYKKENPGLLNTQYLLNPNVSGGFSFANSIGDGTDMSTASAEKLESYWIPRLMEHDAQGRQERLSRGGSYYGATSIAAQAAQRSLDEWRANFKTDRKIKKG